MKEFNQLLKNIGRSMRYSFYFTPWLTAVIMIGTTLVSILPIYQAKILGDVINKVTDVLSVNGSASAVLGLVILYAVVWSGTSIANSVKLYFEKQWSIKMENGLEIETLKKRVEIDLGHYENPDFQNLIQKAFNRSIWPIYRIVDLSILSFGNLAVIIVSSIIATRLSPTLYLAIMITSLPMFFINLKYGRDVWSIWSENSARQREFQHLRFHLQSRTGILQAKIFQAGDSLVNKARAILKSFEKDLIKADSRKMWLSIVASLIAASGYAFGFYVIVADVAEGKTSIGAMVFLISSMGYLVGAIGGLLGQIATMNEFSLYATDIFQVYDTKPFIKRSKKPMPLTLKEAPTIEFKNVSFAYPGDKHLTLKDMSFVIKPGEKIALVGQNGAGKSTLVKLLARIYDPTAGEILINGKDLKKINPEDWGKYVAVLLQDYLMYEFTVGEHIAMGRSDKPTDPEKVELAAELSGATEFIGKYEKGLGQRLGKEFEEGVEPSKGQRQKLALAKTIYRDALVMILDEPTAAIDATAEQFIFDQMEKASGDNTLVVITHRFNTTQKMDKIIVLDHNVIAEVGTHDELISKSGLYKEMFDTQKKAFAEKGKNKGE